MDSRIDIIMIMIRFTGCFINVEMLGPLTAHLRDQNLRRKGCGWSFGNPSSSEVLLMLPSNSEAVLGLLVSSPGSLMPSH